MINKSDKLPVIGCFWLGQPMKLTHNLKSNRWTRNTKLTLLVHHAKWQPTCCGVLLAGVADLPGAGQAGIAVPLGLGLTGQDGLHRLEGQPKGVLGPSR